MAVYTLDFEKPLLELEKQIEELKRVAGEKAELAKNLRPLAPTPTHPPRRCGACGPPATRPGPIRSTTSTPYSPISWSCTATACTATTPPSSAAGRGSPASPSCSSDNK